MLDDDELNATLEGLGLSRENQQALVLMPLIEVAWADGRIQRAERVRLVQIARQYGVDGRDPWLVRWLDRKPSRKVFLAARTALLDQMARGETGYQDGPIGSLDDLIDWCMWIAEAAGGFFGLAFTIERSERECIEQIAASLSLGPALPDGIVEQWEMSRRRHFLAEAPTNMRRRGPRYGILDQTTAHLNLSQLPTATIALQPTSSSDSDPQPHVRPTLEPVASSSDSSPPPAPRAELREDLRTTERPAPKPAPVLSPSAPPPVPAHLAAVSHPARSGAIASIAGRANPDNTRRKRSPEEDPTLPFFDDVNVGTYVDPPE